MPAAAAGSGQCLVAAVDCLLPGAQRQDEAATERNRQAMVTGGAVEARVSHVLLTDTVMGWAFRLVIAGGSVLIGGLRVVMWLFGANQLLDRSAGEDTVIEAVGVRQTKGENRTFEVTFQRPDPASRRPIAVIGILQRKTRGIRQFVGAV